jgi:hypothetical protein
MYYSTQSKHVCVVKETLKNKKKKKKAMQKKKKKNTFLKKRVESEKY